MELSVKRLSSAGPKTTLSFKVTDTGIGIPADKLDTLFESFKQVQSSDSRIYGGTGLGLSISKELVALQGGTISVVSTVGRGSSFSFELTFHEGSLKKLQQRVWDEQEADGSALAGLRILLVDDNEYNRMVAAETLMARAEVVINEATNGREAIDMLTLHDYDVVLMDIQMPVMNGLEATRYIRSNLPEPKNKIPIIALTASLLKDDADQCSAAGMNAFLPKPFKTWQLISALSKVTGRKLAKIKAQRAMERAAPVATESKNPNRVTDLEYLEEFCELDKERMKKFIVAYIKSVPVFTGRINNALAINDKNEVARQIHALKPRWALMGMETTKELAVKIEKQIKEEVDASFTEHVSTLVGYALESVKELEETL